MDNGRRPGGSAFIERLGAELARARDRDSLAQTLLTGLIEPGDGLPGVRGAALGLVEGAGRRMCLLFSDDDLGEPGEPGRPPAWTYVDAFDDVPLNHVARTGEPVLGCGDDLHPSYREFVRARKEKGTASLAVLPLPPLGADPPARPLGSLLLCYDTCREFGPEARHELDLLAEVVSDALRRVDGSRAVRAATWAEPAAAGDAATMELTNDDRAPAAARHFLRERLRSWGVTGEAAVTAELCVSELVTNAVIHGGSASQLAVALTGAGLEVSVSDQGGASAHERVRPVHEQGGPLRVYGRGLMIVEALSSSWGADALPEGTSVWFTLGLAGAT